MRQKNVSLSIESQLEIVKMKEKEPSMTNSQLAKWAKDEFRLGKLPDPSTISKILKRGAQGLIIDEGIKNQKRMRKGKWPQIEEAVILWINIAKNNKTPITWNLIRAKADMYAKTMGIDDFRASSGWLANFGRRNFVKMPRLYSEKRYFTKTHRLCGEASSTDDSAIQIDKAIQTD